VQADGKVVIGGNFGVVSGQNFPYLARLGATGVPDTTYLGYANNAVYALALQSDGKLLVGGEFSTIGGQPAVRLARLNGTGELDNSFTLGTGPNAAVYTLGQQPAGHVVIGGAFDQFNGLRHVGIARVLTSDTAVVVPFRFDLVTKVGTQIQMRGTGGIGLRYVLEYTRDFKNWFGLDTNTPSVTTINFTDPNPTDGYRSYRVLIR